MLKDLLIKEEYLKNREKHLKFFCSDWKKRYDQLYENYGGALLDSLDFDLFFSLISGLYSNKGAPAKNQAQILLSLFFFFNSAETSLSKWVNNLESDPALKILIGLSPTDKPPSLGSYYNFVRRLSGKLNESKQEHIDEKGRNNKKPKKPKGNNKAEDGSSHSSQDLAEGILKNQDYSSEDLKLMRALFNELAIKPSAKAGLIDLEETALSGDGTCLPVHSNPSGNKRKGLEENLRFYTTPQADWGWDSSKKMHYFGFNLYLLSYYNPQLKKDLPIDFNTFAASTHDSIAFLRLLSGFFETMPELAVHKIILDSAHDNQATYELCQALDIEPFIDLSGRRKLPEPRKGKKFDKLGTPVCEANEPMKFKGYSAKRKDTKWVCPKKECTIACSCKSLYTSTKQDKAYFTITPRNSEAFKKTYNRRTASERINKQILVDYRLEARGYRCKALTDFGIFIAMLCIHLKAQNELLA